MMELVAQLPDTTIEQPLVARTMGTLSAADTRTLRSALSEAID